MPLQHAIAHNAPRFIKRPHMLSARHEIPNASEALPECFDAEARLDLRPREPPSMAIWRITSHIVGGSVGGFSSREHRLPSIRPL